MNRPIPLRALLLGTLLLGAVPVHAAPAQEGTAAAPPAGQLDPFAQCQGASAHAEQQLQKVLAALEYQGKPIRLCRSNLVPSAVAWSKLVGHEQHPYISWQKKPLIDQYITYNPTFMYQLEALARNPHATHAILAHAVGHHLKGHVKHEQPYEGFARPWQQEVEADYHVGQALARLGASAADLQALQLVLFSLWEDIDHPQARARIQSLVEGWHAAGGAEIGAEQLDTLRAIMAEETADW